MTIYYFGLRFLTLRDSKVVKRLVEMVENFHVQMKPAYEHHTRFRCAQTYDTCVDVQCITAELTRLSGSAWGIVFYQLQ